MSELGAFRVPEEGRLVRLVRSLGFVHATAHDDLLELGLNSLQILQLSSDIEREFETTFDLSMLLAESTLDELEKRLWDGRDTR